jgi:hypothetical protein
LVAGLQASGDLDAIRGNPAKLHFEAAGLLAVS